YLFAVAVASPCFSPARHRWSADAAARSTNKALRIARERVADRRPNSPSRTSSASCVGCADVVSPDVSTSDGHALSMREMSLRSGVSEGTLRMWEARHGFPIPHRLPSGHRRYSELDLKRVRAIVQDRDQGLSLATAIERARQLSDEPRPSVYSA